MASPRSAVDLSCCYALFFFFLLLLFYSPSRAQGRSVAAVYVLGDSLVDVGNNNYLPPPSYKANFPHNGIDYPGGMATGRFSNGKNPADFLAEKLGLQTSPPYLSLPKSNGLIGRDAFLKGISFASAGAGVLNTTNKGRCLALGKQIELFSKVHGALVHHLGRNETQKHLSRSMFVVSIGSNDLLGFFTPGSPQRAKASPRQFVDSLLSTLRSQLRGIYDLGARKIVFVGAGPIGCLPSVRLRDESGECDEESNRGASKLNKGVSALLKRMKSEHGDMSYSFADAYTSMIEYVRKPSTYGFVEVKAACCGTGNLNAEGPCLPAARYCSNRSGHVFWDSYHPTEAVSRLFTGTIFDGSLPYVYPLNVRKLVAL